MIKQKRDVEVHVHGKERGRLPVSKNKRLMPRPAKEGRNRVRAFERKEPPVNGPTRLFDPALYVGVNRVTSLVTVYCVLCH